MSKSKGEQEKIRLEHDAAKLFMRAYEKESGQVIRHIWHNKPRKPDTSCMLNGEHLDIEIAHLYGSELEAMKYLGRGLTEESKLALHLLEHSEDVNERLLTALNLILENKSKKRYHSDRVWLVIRSVHPEWDADAIKHLLPRIKAPKGHPFHQIWMVTGKNEMPGIIRID